MRVLKVVESKRRRRVPTGRMTSIYGAAPWTTEAEAQDWDVVTVGWTWMCDNGTVGLGRKPAQTREEAEAVMQRINHS